MAEGEGFEPPVPFRVHRFSRPTVSTTHTSLRVSILSLTARAYKVLYNCVPLGADHPARNSLKLPVVFRSGGVRKRRFPPRGEASGRYRPTLQEDGGGLTHPQ